MTATPLLALLLVTGMGFAAHRASLCTVRAVSEVMTSGTAYMLASFAKAVLWTMAVSGSLILLCSADPQPVFMRLPSTAALLGGFVFGVGAAINGGYSFSTLQRLADGETIMMVSLIGMIAGFVGTSYGVTQLPALALHPVNAGWPWRLPWAGALLGTLWIWAAWELVKLYRGSTPNAGLLGRLLADPYRFSSAAAVLGIGGGFLYAVQGAWTYTNFLRNEASYRIAAAPPPSSTQALLLSGLVVGMLLSSWHRGALRLRKPVLSELPAKLVGGLLMSVGGTLIPGGNDTLLLAAIPTIPVHAGAVFIALLAGVASALAVMRRRLGGSPMDACAGDRCHGTD